MSTIAYIILKNWTAKVEKESTKQEEAFPKILDFGGVLRTKILKKNYIPKTS